MNEPNCSMGFSITSRITYQLEGSKKLEFRHVLYEINSFLLSQYHFLLVSGNLEYDFLETK